MGIKMKACIEYEKRRVIGSIHNLILIESGGRGMGGQGCHTPHHH
jgi:hypothetical protein